MNDNLIWDEENKIKILKNSKDFFIIQKFEHWNYSLIIKFKLSEPIIYMNLYFIIKSYVCFNKLSPYSLCTVFKIDNEIIVTQKTNINWFINMDFYMFKDWINFRVKQDSKYEDKADFFGIVLLYSKNLINLYKKENESIELLKPKYPWSDKWINEFKNEIKKTELLNLKVQLLEEELSKFKN